MRRELAICFAACAVSAFAVSLARLPVHAAEASSYGWTSQAVYTSTPIKHLVVIFQENVSFDHYFGTYPSAVNGPGEPTFYARPFTPKINGLTTALLTNNPNKNNTGNGTAAINPFRLSRAQAATADQDHAYGPEQHAFDNGAMDLFPRYTGIGETLPGAPASEDGKGQVMGYFDGNTVTALWNYAQLFAMSDNSYGSTFGPSTVGAINLASGQTNGVTQTLNGTADEIADGEGGLTLIADADPIGDVCSAPTGNQARLGGKNIGDLLNGANITWGFFAGGFDLSLVNANGTTGCARTTTSPVTKVRKADYIPHHEPFQYYASTANPTHLRPTSVAMIGHQGDAANHQYDLNDFYAAVQAGNFPSVSFLKAPGYQDGHAGYSDPLDEQQFIVHVMNFLQQRPEWSSTAVVIAYDDSDGWYDHQYSPRVNASTSPDDALNGADVCGSGSPLPGVHSNGKPVQGRCGYGPRLPLLVISPWVLSNSVDHTVTDQTSIIRFVEDNWLNGERLGGGSFDAVAGSLNHLFDFLLPVPNTGTLILDEQTGEPVK
ncbi:phospholipase C [Dyella japonica]|uniref:Phospholipase C n=1 Tax=Dyella japonica A8 TaxID=1217721 RepID=A0A075JZP8_9GAMM|nr:alkaline phosphatase family protein [Dyella japonica]AIF47409.1 phospholipase C [Dyella japonica A8]